MTKHSRVYDMGTADHYYDANIIAGLIQSTRGELILAEGANHALEIPGNLHQSIQALGQVVTAVERFLVP